MTFRETPSLSLVIFGDPHRPARSAGRGLGSNTPTSLRAGMICCNSRTRSRVWLCRVVRSSPHTCRVRVPRPVAP
eukprot:2001381-Prymnesium_polylepis.1